MKYNPEKHHRRSIRLKGYDYAQAGLYFVTICTQNRACLFGEIARENPDACPEMILNEAGHMIAKWYYELENKFPDIRCGEMVIMPNHIHFIVQNVGTAVGADLCVCPNHPGADLCVCPDRPVGADLCVCPDPENDNAGSGESESELGESESELGESESELGESESELGEHIGSPLHRVVQWFKTMATNEYIRGVKTLGWPRFDGKLCQRNYWERIIRNEREHQNVARYIRDNPKKWHNDKLNGGGATHT